MGYINFDKTRLVNLEYSLDKEILRTNRTGSYSSTTIVGCNTRKYHGLLVCPVDNFGEERHLLLASLDVSVVQEEKTFNIGIHKYAGEHYSPRGHKYLKDFVIDEIPGMSFEVGTVRVRLERLLAAQTDQLLIKYQLEGGSVPVRLQFRPVLGFRSIHALTFENMAASTRTTQIPNGVKIRMYEGFPWLNMQFSKKALFVTVPHWYRGVEYSEEQKRGYDFREDLFVPGFFELELKPGENVVFSASTEEINPTGLKTRFAVERKTKVPRDSYRNCLYNAAQQFIVSRNGKTNIIAGYHWFGSWGRDTFISLPGLTLTRGDLERCQDVMDTQIRKMKGGLFPNMGSDDNPAFNSVDAPLWFIWAVQQYRLAGGLQTRKRYWSAIRSVIVAYASGTEFNIRMSENGLICAAAPGKALTWMDAVTSSGPVTPRAGYNVEINALWYNALRFALDLARKAGDEEFLSDYGELPEKICSSFIDLFWDEEAGYLADYLDEELRRNMDVRPNMLIACSMPYSMIEKDRMKRILDVATGELLTPRGLRTLSPKNPNYKGSYAGDQDTRDSAYHQGTVWPWLMGPYCEAYLKVYGSRGVSRIRELVNGFEDVMSEHGISTISEVYDGDPPHLPGGTISQAWSVAEILRVMDLLDQAGRDKNNKE
jgi:predicted glycogen debranching enzyme